VNVLVARTSGVVGGRKLETETSPMAPGPEERHTQDRIATLSRRQDTARRSREELEARVEVLEQRCVDLSRLVLRLVDDDLPDDLLDEDVSVASESDEPLERVVDRIQTRMDYADETSGNSEESSVDSYL